MKKFHFLLLSISIFFFSFESLAQLSVYVSILDGNYGWAVGSENGHSQRDNKANENCVKNGGKNPTWGFPGNDHDPVGKNDQYGCYALVTGTDGYGLRYFGMSQKRKTKEEALETAKWMLNKEVDRSTISVVVNDCLEKPKVGSSVQPAMASAAWTDWTSDKCFPNLQYRWLGKDVYDLNHQFHYYFEIINNYKETIILDFNLLDKDGKIRFGERRSIGPGKTLQFNHKMTDNYIASFQVEKVCFNTDNGKYQECGDNKPATVKIDKAEIERDAKKNIDFLCRRGKLEYKNEVYYEKNKVNDKRLDDQIEAINKELEKHGEKMHEKYNKEKNKEAYDYYMKIFGEEYDKCKQYMQTG